MKQFTRQVHDCRQCPNYQPRVRPFAICNVTQRSLSFSQISEDIPDWCPLPDVSKPVTELTIGEVYPIGALPVGSTVELCDRGDIEGVIIDPVDTVAVSVAPEEGELRLCFTFIKARLTALPAGWIEGSSS